MPEPMIIPTQSLPSARESEPNALEKVLSFDRDHAANSTRESLIWRKHKAAKLLTANLFFVGSRTRLFGASKALGRYQGR